MSEAKRVDAMAGFAAPPFHPILTDAGGGPTFTMLGDHNAFAYDSDGRPNGVKRSRAAA